MNQELEWIEQIAPDMIETLVQRFMIIRHIYWEQPVGRRTLAQEMGLTERVLRTETDFLKKQKLISVSRSGMMVTEKGKELTFGLRKVVDNLVGIQQQEVDLAKFLGISHCMIVPGNSDHQAKVIDLLGELVEKAL